MVSVSKEERNVAKIYNLTVYPSTALIIGGVKIVENTEQPFLQGLGYIMIGFGTLGIAIAPTYCIPKGFSLQRREEESTLKEKIS